MIRAARHQPTRTCVGCRQPDDKAALLRVSVWQGSIAADPDQRRPGRGAYLHVRPECASRAIPRGVARALKTEVRPSVAETLRRAADRARNRSEAALKKGQS